MGRSFNKFKFFYIPITTIAVLYLIYLLLILVYRPILVLKEVDKIQSNDSNNFPITVFYTDNQDTIAIKEGVIQNHRFCLNQYDLLKNCFVLTQVVNNNNIKILSTHTDQKLIHQYIQQRYRSYFQDNRLEVRFIDINKDGIMDLLFHIKSSSKNENDYKYIKFYSSNDNVVLWNLERRADDFAFIPTPSFKILDNDTLPATVVIYEPQINYKEDKYLFYQYKDGLYQIFKPSAAEFKNYLKDISTFSLLFRNMNFEIQLLTLFFSFMLLLGIITFGVTTIYIMKIKNNNNSD